MKRAETMRTVKECMTVSSSEEGVWKYTSDGTDQTCGLYLVTSPDMLIQVEILDLDVDCDNGLLVVFIFILYKYFWIISNFPYCALLFGIF